MSEWLRTAVVLVVGSVAMMIAAPAASADDGRISINTGHGWTHGSTDPLFDVRGIYPGWSESAHMEIRNDSDTASDLAVTVSDIVEGENGCNHPESFADATCGDTEGELGREMQFGIFVDPNDDGGFESTPRWTGSLYDARSAVLVAHELAGHHAIGMRIDAALPDASGNETQTDQVTFDLGLRLDATGASTEVEGTKVTRHGPAGLPFTGTRAEQLVQAALWLIAIGAAVTLAGRSRRRRRRTLGTRPV